MAAHKFNHSRHHRLSGPERQRNLPVEKVLAELGPLNGLKVIDVGCGKGYFSLPFARAVGSTGRVFAVDNSPEMLDLLKAAANGVKNIVPVLSQESSIPLDADVADLLFSCAVYHEFEDRPAMLRELKRLGCPGARHVVIDWNRRSDEHGPPMEARVPEETVVAEHTASGLELIRRFQPGRDYYGLIFREMGQ